MEERRTAAVVIGVVLLIFAIFWMRPTKPVVLTFKGCRVEDRLRDDGFDADLISVSQNTLALCLCEKYVAHKDEHIRLRIIDIYQKYGNHYADSFGKMGHIDSIIKYRKTLLDTVIIRE